MAKPIPVPRAPRPIMIEAAMMTSSIITPRDQSLSSSLSLVEHGSGCSVMVLMGSTQIHHSQHHEDEGLQRNYQNVEDCPRHVQRPLHVEGQKCNQDEHYFTGIHVTEQTQCQTQRLGQQAENLQEQVEGNQRPVIER